MWPTYKHITQHQSNELRRAQIRVVESRTCVVEPLSNTMDLPHAKLLETVPPTSRSRTAALCQLKLHVGLVSSRKKFDEGNCTEVVQYLFVGIEGARTYLLY